MFPIDNLIILLEKKLQENNYFSDKNILCLGWLIPDPGQHGLDPGNILANLANTMRFLKSAHGLLQVQVEQLQTKITALGLQFHDGHFIDFCNLHD